MLRRAVRPFLAVVLVVLTGARPQLDPEVLRAEAMLVRGQVRQAEAILRRLHEAEPDRPRIALSLAVSRARLGKCDEAIPALEALRGQRIWNSLAGTSLANCYTARLDTELALALLVETLQLDSENTEAWGLLARLRAYHGDLAGADDAVGALLARQDSPESMMLLYAEFTYRAGDPDFDVWSAMYLHNTSNARSSFQIELSRWMDLGNPMVAADVGLQLIKDGMRRPAVAFTRAEALRRLNLPEDALLVFERTLFADASETLTALVIRARVLTDLGRFDEANALLLKHPAPAQHDVVASRWYLARARGEHAYADALRERYERQAKPAGRTLDQLIPWVSEDD
jgi:predicted Zn-dependent protease